MKKPKKVTADDIMRELAAREQMKKHRYKTCYDPMPGEKEYTLALDEWRAAVRKSNAWKS